MIYVRDEKVVGGTGTAETMGRLSLKASNLMNFKILRLREGGSLVDRKEKRKKIKEEEEKDKYEEGHVRYEKLSGYNSPCSFMTLEEIVRRGW